MSSAVPEHHPDQDQLADLAAEALPADVARSVEAHVIECSLCSGLLADAERVRRLLFAEDPGRMPDDVWLRLEGAMAAEAVHRRATSGGTPSGSTSWFEAPQVSAAPSMPLHQIDLTQAHPVTAPLPRDPVRVDGRHSDPIQVDRLEVARSVPAPPDPPPSMSFDEAPTAAWRAFLDDPDPANPPADTGPVPIRVGRVRSSARSRRDVRSEDRASERRLRPAMMVAAAVTVVAVAGLGAGGFLLLHGENPATRAAEDFPGPSRSIVSASGRDYTASTLVAQVRALLGAAAPARSAGTGAAGPSRPTPGAASGGAVSGGTTGMPSGSSAAGPVGATAGTVGDPEQLTSCLAGLGEKERRPMAVDLARYQGREAAVIVLPNQTGGFDVWVVPRQCKAGTEMPLAFKSVPK